MQSREQLSMFSVKAEDWGGQALTTLKPNLIKGDSLDIVQQFKENQFDAVFTSPPYNRKRNDKYNAYSDTIGDYFIFLCESIEQCLRVSKGNVFFNIQKNIYNKVEVHKIFGHFAEQITEVLIWNKTNPMPAGGTSVTNAYEYILVINKNNEPLVANNTYTKNNFTTSVYSENPYKKQHRAVMNPQAADYVINAFCQPNSTILDPFMGTGTTGVICNRLNINFTGIELKQEYFDIAKKRLLEPVARCHNGVE